MDARRARERRHAWTPRALLASATLLLALACAIGGAKHAGPRQGWSEDRGPVIPHDSFPRDCSLCHEGGSWNTIKEEFRFDHAQETGVPLHGAHADAQCLRCHNDRGPVGAFAARGCAGCHEDVHRGRLGPQCVDCHDERTWKPRGQIALHDRTRFPLVGAHAAVACVRCHAGAPVQNFDAVSTRCEDCHQEDLARATSPDHAMQGWTSGCERCHVPTAWSGGGFTHPGFPLNGAHAAQACEACHAGGDFGSAPTTCFGCHAADYDATTRPSHASAGFPTTCASCHSTSSWSAQFDHARFPLVGGHAAAACGDCHAGGVFRGTPTTCFACHQDDYASTSDPSHAAAGFPTTCQTCHDLNGWDGADFTHSRFPIGGGPHGGLDCAQCHPSPRSFAQFNCTDCHEHRRSEMDDEHDRVRGYVYLSSACYQCHPDGED